MRAICARHRLSADRLEPFADRTNVVFAAGQQVIKLYPPHSAHLATAAAAPLYRPDFRPAIVTGDIHGAHLLVDDRSGRWRLSGLFDFDDAQVGHGEYDLAAAGLLIFSGQASRLRSFLRGYGYPEARL